MKKAIVFPAQLGLADPTGPGGGGGGVKCGAVYLTQTPKGVPTRVEDTMSFCAGPIFPF